MPLVVDKSPFHQLSGSWCKRLISTTSLPQTVSQWCPIHGLLAHTEGRGPEGHMQEGSQIGWDPISINYHLPLASRVLILYLLVIVTLSLVKSARLLRILWLSKRGSLRPSSPEDEFVFAWERCSSEIHSIKCWGLVTLFWTVLVAAMLLRNNLVILAAQKRFFPGTFFGSIVEMLTIFALGILVCAVLYTACAFYEGALLRRRESWNKARASIENRQLKA